MAPASRITHAYIKMGETTLNQNNERKFVGFQMGKWGSTSAVLEVGSNMEVFTERRGVRLPRVQKGTTLDDELRPFVSEVKEGRSVDPAMVDGLLRRNERVCKLLEELMYETHFTRHSVHTSNTKMCMDLKKSFWWSVMKKDVTLFISKCQTCALPKTECQRLDRLLKYSMTFNLQTDDQTERTNCIMKDMLRMRTLKSDKMCEDDLYMNKFA
ncbi:hypothetical protein KSP39_PZI016433 [Platanthera zijinensis]|uniref:Integrase zinc-binding domain-containing protein n=1 Tax=Platanthera zijinensis TaxID=2320716 RepID=A0AAP0G0W9_9ASPA